jgi:hypothetical protein
MGGFKITNLATGTAATDAATVAQIQSNGAALVTVTGTDTLTGSLTPSLVAYVTGAVYYFVAPATNTGAVTLNIDTLGAKNVTRDGTTVLVSGDIVSGEMVAVVYDGTRFQLISPVNSFTNLNVSGTLTVAGATTLNGNLAVGDAAADTINFKSSGWTLTNNVSVIGTWADIGTITTADINGGTIDGTTIGGGTAAAGTFTTVTATTGNITTVNATTVDSTNLEVTNLKAKDGTAAGSIADATGVVTLNSVVATTADINGGTIDATTIGGSSPAVGNFTTVSAASAVFTTATITTVNTTTLDLTNLEVTNIKAKDGTASMTIDDATGKVNVTTVSAASMNAGVAAVTSLTATGASVASANVGTAVITNGTVTALTATGASIASMNAGVALLTTATVTNFTASGASIASANIGNLQFTAASIASINAGVAVITNLTATGASIASANVGTAVITAATVTGASIASMNAGVALLTTATVTNLTATGASVASANVGTAVVTGLTVTGASIASINAGTATISGNLTLNGGTANGVLYLNGSKVATSGTALVFDGTNFGLGTASPSGAANYSALVINGSTGGWLRLWSGGTAVGSIFANSTDGLNLETATSTPIILKTNATERARIDSSGQLALGTTTATNTLTVQGTVAYNLNSTTDVYKYFTGGAGLVYAGTTTSTAIGFLTNGGERMRLDTSGNLGLGVTPSAWGSPFKAIQGGAASYQSFIGFQSNTAALKIGTNTVYDGSNYKYVNTGAATRFDVNDSSFNWNIAASGTAGNTITFTQAMTLDASGNLGVGTTSPNYRISAIGSNTQANFGATNNKGAFIISTADSQAVYTGGAFYNGSNWVATATTASYIAMDGGSVAFATNSGLTSGNTFTPSERARITSGGYSKFSDNGTYINSTGTAHEFNQSANSSALQLNSTNASMTVDVLYLQATRNTTNNTYYAIGFYNSTAAVYRFQVADSGNVTNTNGSYGTISDAKMKTDIVDAGSQWADIKAVRFRKFKMKDDPQQITQLGVVAQELEQTSPGLVDEHADRDAEGNDLGTTTKSVKSSILLMKSAVALQEAMARIEQLEAKVAALESK